MFMIRRIRARLGRDVEAEDPRLAARRQQQRGEDLDQRRLAGAVGPEQPEELAGRDLEVDAGERDDGLRLRVVDAADAVDGDGGRQGRCGLVVDGHGLPRGGCEGAGA